MAMSISAKIGVCSHHSAGCRHVLLLMWFVLCLSPASGHMFSWLLAPDYSHDLLQASHHAASGSRVNRQTADSAGGEVTSHAQVPFEMAVADDKFLQQAEIVTGLQLSEQEKCQHKVILSVEKSCAVLSEEEMSKVAVQLLNCQSAVESRPVFECTAAMTIAECTRPMDPDTWNAYHIVSNRARAVCYSARQQQFRAAAEIAVNRLTAQTQKQLQHLDSLEAGHSRLEQLTADTLQAVSFGQKQLITQHDTLQTAQKTIKSHVAGNLRELSRVRAAIGVSQTDVAQQLRTLRRALSHTAGQLHRYSMSASESRQLLAEQLHQLSELASALTEKLNHIHSSTELLSAHSEQLASSIQLMNSTVMSLLVTLDRTQQHINDKITWLNHLLGNDIHRVLNVLYHCGFLMLAMLVATFLHAPLTTRLCVLVVVPLNALSALQDGPQLLLHTDIVSLILCATLAHYVVVWLWRRRQKSTLPSSSSVSSHSVHQYPALAVRERSVGSAGDNGVSGFCEENQQSQNTSTHTLAAVPEENAMCASVRHQHSVGSSPITNSLGGSLRVRRLSNISSSSSPAANRVVCVALCKNGQHCRNSATIGSLYCALHGRLSREATPS